MINNAVGSSLTTPQEFVATMNNLVSNDESTIAEVGVVMDALINYADTALIERRQTSSALGTFSIFSPIINLIGARIAEVQNMSHALIDYEYNPSGGSLAEAVLDLANSMTVIEYEAEGSGAGTGGSATPATFEKRVLKVTVYEGPSEGDVIDYDMFIESQADLDAFLVAVNSALQSYGVSVTASTFNTVVAGILSQADAQTKAGFVLSLFHGAKTLGWRTQIHDRAIDAYFDALVSVSNPNNTPFLLVSAVNNIGTLNSTSLLTETISSITLDLLSNS